MSETSTPATSATPASETPIERVTRLVRIPGGVPDLDETLRDVAEDAQARNYPLIVRIQPDLYLRGEGAGTHRHKPWPSVIWKAEFASVDAVIAFRTALEGFVAEYFGTQDSGPGVTSPVMGADETE